MSEETKVLAPAFFGIKAGMTRVFDENGCHQPVTVIRLVPNFISQVKTKENDGYEAYQLAYCEKRESLTNKATKGVLKKANIEKFFTRFSEVKVSDPNPEATGKEVSLEGFEKGCWIDVTGTSKGKGFQGVMKKYNFKGGPAAHGSKFHRTPGSIGMATYPARIFKGKKMPGHMGQETKTVQNLKIVEVNTDGGYLLVKGSVPGAKNSFIRISKAVKKA